MRLEQLTSVVEGIVFAKEGGIAFINLKGKKQIWIPAKGLKVGDKAQVTVRKVEYVGI